jgi:hypothetical protein
MSLSQKGATGRIRTTCILLALEMLHSYVVFRKCKFITQNRTEFGSWATVMDLTAEGHGVVS